MIRPDYQPVPVAADSTEAEREERLDEILAAYLRDLRRGEAPPREVLLARHPDLAEDLRGFFENQDVVAGLVSPLREATGLVEPTAGCPGLDEYEVLAPIAAGGMGVVYRAREKRLNRLVALKVLRRGPLASADELRRFQLEAEVAASLEHPHIVPIHAVGCHEGSPYLSMKLIEGPCLATVLLDGRPTPRQAAELLRVLAETVDHAHQRGILHRDLKPGNILLEGPAGAELTSYHPYISDFGLAYRLGKVEASSGPGDPSGITRTGVILGTPSYMAPEQASGRRADITVAADVYGLGAILYELLTGAPPFRGETPLETIRQVVENVPARPRLACPGLPRDLETICLTCLEKSPGQRYPSARALADDLRRFLEGSPIQARPTGALGRAWRWARRQPFLAAVSAALLLTLASAFVVVTLLWLRADRSSQLAEERARQVQEQLEATERSFQLAHRAVNDFSGVVGDELEQTSGLQARRQELLQTAVGYYQRFLEERGQDPTLRLELAIVFERLAHLTGSSGSDAECRSWYRRAAELYGELLAENPGDVSLQLKLAGAMTNQATAEASPQEKLAVFERARDLYRKYRKADPDNPRLRAGEAHLLSNLGTLEGELGHPDRSLAAYQEACAIYEALLKEDPANTGLEAGLAFALGNLAAYRSHEEGGLPEALRGQERVRQLRERLARAQPGTPRLEADLAGAIDALGVFQREAGQSREAVASFEKALAIRLRLAQENPLVGRHQSDLATTYLHLGTSYSWARQRDRALEMYGEAARILRKMVSASPTPSEHRRRLGLALFNMSVVHGALDQRGPERARLEEAAQIQQQLVQENPANPDHRHQLGRTLHNLAYNLQRTGRTEEALPLLGRAIEHQRAAHQQAPHRPDYAQILAIHYGLLTDLETRLGHWERALRLIEERCALFRDRPGDLYRCAVAAARLAARPELPAGLRGRSRAQVQATLKRALAAGFRDRQQVEKDPAFAAALAWPEIRQVLDEMAPEGPQPP